MEQKVIVAGVRNLVIDAIMQHIEDTEGLRLVAFIESAAQLKPASEKLKPDCIFICPSIFDTVPQDGHIEFLQNHGTFNLLVATLAVDHQAISDLLAGGVRGILLLREVCAEELLDAIDRVAQGKHYVSPDVAQMLCDAAFQKPQNTVLKEALTDRESEISRLVANGLTSKEIARTLEISPATVNAHRRNIMMKTGVRKATALTKLVHALS